jgi:hypothetical protein
LLPDNWACPSGITFKSGFYDIEGQQYYAAYQTFTTDQWSKLEVAGAVFLPAAGYRYGSNVGDMQSNGTYSSATDYTSRGAYYIYFNSSETDISNSGRCVGRSVRLVKDL